MADTVIASWFVADDASTATFFPQVDSRSDAPAAQAIYWRCLIVFFASSLARNPNKRHVLFTNTTAPTVDGVNLHDVLARWDVELVYVPITYRLPPGSSERWGNQFYIFDILDYFAAQSDSSRLIVLDSDCIWRKPVCDIEQAIDKYGLLSYHIDYPTDKVINGLSSEKLGSFVAAAGGQADRPTPYSGGEIFAGTKEAVQRVAAQARHLWSSVLVQDQYAPREEAHLLSAIYAIENFKVGTANAFIRRIWTAFRFSDRRPSDFELAIWHLPSEKKTGLSDLFRGIISDLSHHPAEDPEAMGLSLANMARKLGYPRPTTRRLLRDAFLRLRAKLAA